jgi:hypothetical protein
VFGLASVQAVRADASCTAKNFRDWLRSHQRAVLSDDNDHGEMSSTGREHLPRRRRRASKSSPEALNAKHIGAR